MTKIVGNVEQKGFSLIELSLVLTLVLVFAGLSQSKLSELYFKHQLRIQTNQLLRFLQTARQAGFNQFSHVTLCPSANQIKCDSVWSLPLMFFIDDNKNGIVDNADYIVAVNEPIFDLTSNRGVLHFAPVFSAANSAATLKICRSKAGRIWRTAVVISNMGRIRKEQNLNKISC